jgi:N-acetylglucosaminyldiphosphoundecaprenol N-acetyl-beta-D-mannosaminyltransferase
MPRQTEFDQLDILGVTVDAASNEEAIDYICRRAAAGQPPMYVAKPYVEFVDRAYHRPQLQELINGAELTIPDGVALCWAATYLYAGKRSVWRFWLTLFQIVLAPDQLRWPLPDRAAGITFTLPLLKTAAKQGLRVYLVGEPAGSSIEHTAEVVARRVPDLTIAGTHSGRDTAKPAGEVGEGWLAEVAGDILAARADLILVGVGFPLQERVCRYLATHTEHGVYIGEGGTFDYEQFGGRRPKAPAAWQRIGLEWLWRLVQEPSRARRQLAIPRFIYRVWQARA